MSNLTSTSRIKPIAATQAKVYNLSMPNANTEYSQAISDATKRLVIRTRIISTLRMAYLPTETSSNYITVPAGCSRNIESIDLNSFTLYLRSDVPNQIVEIEEWS